MKTELENNYRVTVSDPKTASYHRVLINNYSKVREKLKSKNDFITFDTVSDGKLHSLSIRKNLIVSIDHILKN